MNFDFDLSQREGFVLVGGFKSYGDNIMFYANEVTGDVVFQTLEGAEMMIGELAVKAPSQIANEEVVNAILDRDIYEGTIGFIMAQEGMYFLISEELAMFRQHTNLQEGGTPIKIDMDVVYEEEDEE